MVFEIRELTKESAQDLNLKNEAFAMPGRFIPELQNGVWSYRTESFDAVQTDVFPDENYDFDEIAGKGVSASIFMQEVLVGNAKLLKEKEIAFFEISRTGTVIYVAIAGECAGYVVLEDTLKKDSVNAIKGLYALGIRDISVSILS